MKLDRLYSIDDIVNMKTATLSTRLNEEEIEDLDSLSRSSGLDRANLLKLLIRRGVREMRLELAVKSFTEERITLSRAAELAGMPLSDFMSLLPRPQPNLRYDVEEFEEDLQGFRV